MKNYTEREESRSLKPFIALRECLESAGLGGNVEKKTGL